MSASAAASSRRSRTLSTRARASAATWERRGAGPCASEGVIQARDGSGIRRPSSRRSAAPRGLPDRRVRLAGPCGEAVFSSGPSGVVKALAPQKGLLSRTPDGDEGVTEGRYPVGQAVDGAEEGPGGRFGQGLKKEAPPAEQPEE